MDDLISRQQAIDALIEWYGYEPSDIGAFENIIDKLPSAQPEPRWIPCSERLPEDIRPVIVTWKNTDPKSYYQYIVGKHFMGTACYKNGKWYWYSSTTEDMLAEYGRYDSEEFDEAIECIAWMPLPEPYKIFTENKKYVMVVITMMEEFTQNALYVIRRRIEKNLEMKTILQYQHIGLTRDIRYLNAQIAGIILTSEE